jgi:hypothetical protein
LIKTAKDALDALISHRLSWPEVAVDLSGGGMEMQALIELLERKGIPCLTLQTEPLAPFVPAPSSFAFSNHFGDLAACLMEFRNRPRAAHALQDLRQDSDGGWESFKRRFEENAHEGVGALPD